MREDGRGWCCAGNPDGVAGAGGGVVLLGVCFLLCWWFGVMGAEQKQDRLSACWGGAMWGSESPPAWPEILWRRLPVDNRVCGSCLGALGPWLTSGLRLQWDYLWWGCQHHEGCCWRVARCSPAPLHRVPLQAERCLLSWILRGKKKLRIVVFIVAAMISKYSDGDKMLFQLPLVNINSSRSLSQ